PAGARFGYRAAVPATTQLYQITRLFAYALVFYYKKTKPRRSEVWLSCGGAGNDSVLSDYAFICVRVSLFLNYCNAHTPLLFLMSQ
ncbi:hypothetical protein, partial [Serratia marcescens]|uniref:hypothetical protein n=1 Tax=Serratia marcescens TaxID=615 RepID=UPI003B855CAA